MSRMARFLKDGACYYIQSQSYKNQKIFRTDSDYEQYIRLLRKYKSRFQVSIYGYCFMKTVVYLIVHPGDSTKLPLFMQGVNQSYALFFNSCYKRTGKVWGQRYKSILLNSGYDLFECVKSIEFIPVKRRQSLSPVEYPWSSCASRVLGLDSVVDFVPPEELILPDKF